MGGNLPLPMYGVGTNRNVDFKYAGAVIKLRVWAKEGLEAHSCVFSASGLYKKAFTYIDKKEGKWKSLQPAHNVDNLKLSMNTPLKISTDENNPTEILMVLPLSGERTLKNLKFSINCTRGGAELKKKSDLEKNSGANRVGPTDGTTKTLYVPKGCVDAYTTAWKVLLDEGN